MHYTTSSKVKTLGVVPYLNTEPFLAFLELEGHQLLKQSPAELEQSYQRGKVQAALLPVLSLFRGVKGYIVDGMCIGSHSEARSVLVFLNSALEKVKKVGLDESSLSSRYLTQLLFQEYYHLDCQFELGNPKNWMKSSIKNSMKDQKDQKDQKDRIKESVDAYLLIGDLALLHRKDRIDKKDKKNRTKNQNHANDSEQKNFLDLGQVWNEWTGFPFIFAVWLSKERDFSLKKSLLESLDKGKKSIQTIVQKRFTKPEGWEYNYLEKNLFYILDDEGKKALFFYQEALYRAGLLPELLPLCFY